MPLDPEPLTLIAGEGVFFRVRLNGTERQLILDLLHGHRTNLAGALAALAAEPRLALVADEGETLLTEQLQLTDATLAALR